MCRNASWDIRRDGAWNWPSEGTGAVGSRVDSLEVWCSLLTKLAQCS